MNVARSDSRVGFMSSFGIGRQELSQSWMGENLVNKEEQEQQEEKKEEIDFFQVLDGGLGLSRVLACAGCGLVNFLTSGEEKEEKKGDKKVQNKEAENFGAEDHFYPHSSFIFRYCNWYQKNSSMLLSFISKCRSKSITKIIKIKTKILHSPGAVDLLLRIIKVKDNYVQLKRMLVQEDKN